MIKRIRINYDFFILTLCLWIFNLPLLDPGFIPLQDTFNGFNIFYYFYNHLFFSNQLAQWVPYGVYGMPTGLDQVANLTPLSYLLMFVGYVFRITNVLNLFKFTLLAEQAVFLLGMYFLCRFIYKKRSTVFFVCLSAVGSVVCYTQIFFNFHIYYLLPFVIYFWLLFFNRKQSGFFWVGCLTCLLWMMGCNPYYAGLIFLWAFFFLMTFLFRDKQCWRMLLERSKTNFLFFILFVSFLCVFVYFLKDTLDYVSMISRSRNYSGHVELSTFLSWGGNLDLSRLFKGFLFPAPAFIRLGSFYDNTLYIGLASIFFFLWALWKVRNFYLFAFLIPAIILLWLSFGGAFACLVYHFVPFIAYFRHIGLIGSLIKIFILIIAGLGFENFIDAPWKRRMYGFFTISALLIFVYDSFHWSQQEVVNLDFLRFSFRGLLNRSEDVFKWVSFYIYSIFIFIGGLGCFFIRVYYKKNFKYLCQCCLIGALFFACFLDMFAFQQAALKAVIPFAKKQYNELSSVLVHKFPFQKERFFFSIARPPKQHLSERQKNALQLFNFLYSGRYDVSGYQFLQIDPLSQNFQKDFFARRLKELLALKKDSHLKAEIYAENIKKEFKTIGPDFKADTRMKKINELLGAEREDNELVYIFGGYYPKLRLVPKAHFVPNSTRAIEAVSALPDIIDTVVVTKDGHVISQHPSSSHVTLSDTQDVVVTDFNANQLTADVFVTDPAGSWLVYADAYHPAWQVAINGKRGSVLEAYGAFKTIYLKAGRHLVTFYYFNGWGTICSYLFALVGLLAASLLMFLYFANLFGKVPFLDSNGVHGTI